MSAGVARQYTGTAGRVENCQVGVFLAYRAPGGARALADRELCLPRKWAEEDRERCRAAGIGGEVPFATKPRLAKSMFARAVKAGVPFRRAAGDEVYGASPGLREWLEEQEKGYVLAVACNATVEARAGPKRAGELTALVPAGAWQRISCAGGSKGPRLHDWALIATDREDRHLMIRRPLQPGEKGELELAFYRCCSPEPVTLAELAAVAGARWGIEGCFAEAKNEAGLDHCQVRRYRAWYRHVTLAMLAHAFLAVAAHAARPPEPASARGNTGNEPVKKGT
jgi:SRSO17 transposase